MNEYPDCETYKALYKRYYDGRKPEELLYLAGALNDKVVLDLCAGDGRLSLDAAKRGAHVYLVEKEVQMQSFLTSMIRGHGKFDAVFCQQGINYWLNENMAKLVACVLKENGVFIFNTFNKKPSEKPVVKEYELDGKKFAEISWLVGDTVHHVQVREGMPSHATSFRWLSPEYLEEILSPYFTIEVKNDGPSSLYRCSRK